MGEKSLKGLTVDSELGKKKVDFNGSAISAVRLDASKVYDQIPSLLQRYINNKDSIAWLEIVKKIDYIYSNINYLLSELDKEVSFSNKVKSDIGLGKKLLFKPNIVGSIVIDPSSHGESAGKKTCTEWPLVAALMRWFHDTLNISYSQMAIGEGSTSTFMFSAYLSKMAGQTITTESIIEGRSGDFYGGWGFFFVRKYLEKHHPTSHRDNPMNGYKESVEGTYLAPGDAGDNLMVYDLNKLQEDMTRGRDVTVPGGTNYKKITLHKVIIGGDINDKEDMKKYPGCILINVPKPKMHDQDLLTNAIKNLGIGLYPSQCIESKEKNYVAWKYAYPPNSHPTYKGKLPHCRWIMEIDEKTNLPLMDKNGQYVSTRTDGFSGTQADVLMAVKSQNVFMLHVDDAINISNKSHDVGNSEPVKEGLFLASLDCVALDLFVARYCFKTVPMAQALKLKTENNWNTEFIQKVPVAKVKGNNIITEHGFDSPLLRYDLYRYAEARGVGQQLYYIVGFDNLTKTPLVSLDGHLGRLNGTRFVEVMTKTMYYSLSSFMHHLQNTAFSYLKSCDALTCSSIFDEIMDIYDENKDGVIDYDEKGRGCETAMYSVLGYAYKRFPEKYGILKTSFLVVSILLKCACKDWNPQGHDFNKDRNLVDIIESSYELSQGPRNKDLFIHEMTYGDGMWPSWKTAEYITFTKFIYGSHLVDKISLSSLYGITFQYADKAFNSGKYTGGTDENAIIYDSIQNYFKAINNGAQPLNFTLYVPFGYGSLEGIKIPNVEETKDSSKILTANFEIWG